LGRFAEAQAEAERAVELDPASPVVNNMLGVVFYSSRDYARAIDAFNRTVELDPRFAPARGFLACAYLGAGKNREALEQIAQMTDAEGEHMALRAWVLSVAGEREAAARVASEAVDRSRRDPIRPGILAGLYWMLGDRDGAFALLDQAYAERDWTMRELKVNPMFDPMRGDPRFARLLKKLNLG
jgi:tetratricopeptide (TPR) repeat protein